MVLPCGSATSGGSCPSSTCVAFADTAPLSWSRYCVPHERAGAVATCAPGPRRRPRNKPTSSSSPAPPAADTHPSSDRSPAPQRPNARRLLSPIAASAVVQPGASGVPSETASPKVLAASASGIWKTQNVVGDGTGCKASHCAGPHLLPSQEVSKPPTVPVSEPFCLPLTKQVAWTVERLGAALNTPVSTNHVHNRSRFASAESHDSGSTQAADDSADPVATNSLIHTAAAEPMWTTKSQLRRAVGASCKVLARQTTSKRCATACVRWLLQVLTPDVAACVHVCSQLGTVCR